MDRSTFIRNTPRQGKGQAPFSSEVPELLQHHREHPRNGQNLGWSKMAEVYRKLTGEYVSRDTMKRRYLEAKRQIKDSLEVPANESLR